jgi:hypothetical protein
MWPSVAVHAERAGDFIGVWWVTRIPEASDHNEPLFPVWAPERSHASDLNLLGTLLNGSLKVLRVIVLAPKNNNILQSAADE